MMKSLFLRHLINLVVAVTFSVVLSCTSEIPNRSDGKESSDLVSGNSDIKSVNGILIFKSNKILFNYLGDLGKKSIKERKILEAKYKFTSLSTSFDDINDLNEKEISNGLLIKKNDVYDFKIGALVFGNVINKSGYFIVGNYLKMVENQYVKSVKINNYSLPEIEKASLKIINHKTIKSDSEILVSEIQYKTVDIKSSENTRVYPDFTLGNSPFVVESNRINPYASNGYKFSVKGTLYFINYLTYAEYYCDGGYNYDDDCRCYACDGQMIYEDEYRYTNVFGTVQGLVDGSPTNSSNYTSSVSVYGSLNLYHPGEPAIPLFINQGINGASMNFTIYNTPSTNLSNLLTQLEGQLTFGAVFDLSNYLSGRPPFSVSVLMNL